MSELEDRLAAGLTGAGDRAPHPGDLAGSARSRLRRRRRTTAAVVAAALAVVAIPVVVTVVGGTPQGDPAPADRRESTVADDPPSEWRTETWRDLSVTVPPDWTNGGGAGWCTAGSLERAGSLVSRPGGVTPAIGCRPGYPYGAHFTMPSRGEPPSGTEGVVQQYRGDRFPDGAWVGHASTEQAVVWVVAADRTTARQVLDSATPVGEVDANGCATRVEMSSPPATAQVSVCRYTGDGWLEQSELLSKEDSDATAQALRAAASDGGSRCTLVLDGDAPVVLLSGNGVSATVRWDGTCPNLIVGPGEASAELTEDVLYWALSPGWSGAVPRGVPLPERLRDQ